MDKKPSGGITLLIVNKEMLSLSKWNLDRFTSCDTVEAMSVQGQILLNLYFNVTWHWHLRHV